MRPGAQGDSSCEGLVLARAHAWHVWRFSLDASDGSVARCLGLACLGLRSLGLSTPETSLSQYKSCPRCDSSASQARRAVDAWREVVAGMAEDFLANTGLLVHLLMLVSRLATLRCLFSVRMPCLVVPFDARVAARVLAARMWTKARGWMPIWSNSSPSLPLPCPHLPVNTHIRTHTPVRAHASVPALPSVSRAATLAACAGLGMLCPERLGQ